MHHDILFICRCQVKAFKPPTSFPDYRACRLDSEEYVATCPSYTYAKEWSIGKLCETGPVSFVYEGSSIGQLLYAETDLGDLERTPTAFQLNTQAAETDIEFVFKDYKPLRKYRNSYCASCNGAAWLGCHVNKTMQFIGENPKESERQFSKHWAGGRKFMYIFQIDYNKRTCIRHSDSYIVYPQLLTGRDMCINVTRQLRQCDYEHQYDIEKDICTSVPYAFESFEKMNSSSQTDENLTRHLLNLTSTSYCNAQLSFHILSGDKLIEECLRSGTSSLGTEETNISTTLPSLDVNPLKTYEHHPVFSLAYESALRFTSIYCAAANESFARCENDIYPTTDCLALQFVSMQGNYENYSMTIPKPQLLIQHEISINYSATGYTLHIEKLVTSASYDVLFATFVDAGHGYCSKYTHINDQSLLFHICPNNTLKQNHENGSARIHQDFYLQGHDIGLCVEFTYPGFQINITDYVLSALSMVIGLIYLIHYIVKGKKTLTSYFIVSSLCTLLAALLCYCFVNQGTPGTAPCSVLASLNQYFMLATHTWTNALAIWMFRGITTVKLISDRSTKSYFYYAAYAWLSPLVFVSLAYALDSVEFDGLYPVYSSYVCFIEQGWIRLLLFTGPIFLLIFVNITLCIAASLKVFSAGNQITASDRQRTKRKIITVTKLQIIFGLHWFLLYFTWIKGVHEKVLWQVLGVLISLQGTFLVLAQVIKLNTCVEKTRRSFRRKTPKQSSGSKSINHESTKTTV